MVRSVHMRRFLRLASTLLLLLLLIFARTDGEQELSAACSSALSQPGVHQQFSGASALDASAVHRLRCGRAPGHVYVVVRVQTRLYPGSSWDYKSESVGACLPSACAAAFADGASGAAGRQPGEGDPEAPSGDDAEMAETREAVVRFLQQLMEYRCRDGHPTVRHTWPDGVDGELERYVEWVKHAHDRLGNPKQIFTRDAVDECPSAACTTLAMIVNEAPVGGALRLTGATEQENVDEALLLMETCMRELTSDLRQVKLLSYIGYNLAGIENALTKLRAWAHELRPRNPHHDDHRLVWRDHYQGLYEPVNYSIQFDLQWKLALLRADGFGQESSVQVDDCALNDMIESTFGERNYLPGCTAELAAEHASRERGISRRNSVLLDIENYKYADVLDVGCGFGRWTAMMTRIGATVTSVDASPHAVESTRRFNPDRTHQMSLFDLASVPGYAAGFDLVICWGVMHHTHDPKAAFQLVAGAVKEGGMLFVQIYSDQSKAAYPFTQGLRRLYRDTAEAAGGSEAAQVEFLRHTHAAAGADVFDHLDGMLTFYNWVVHEETVKSWFTACGFEDYWKVWNYKYLGRKRSPQAPVRDDAGNLLKFDLGESSSGVRYYPYWN